MTMLEWLSGTGRREARVRIDAAWKRFEERQERRRALDDLTQRVLQLVYEAEMRGERPKTLYLPADEIARLDDAFLALSEDTMAIHSGVVGSFLLGLKIEEGSELRVE